MWIYVGLFFFESFTLYLYYYGWDRWKDGRAKWGHWTLGHPAQRLGHDRHVHRQRLAHVHDVPARRASRPTRCPTMVELWSAIANATWMPINIHRLIANVGVRRRDRGAPTRRTASSPPRPTKSARTTTGWATSATSSRSARFIVLPFAGYWLGREIYEYNQQMGITMMGGFMSWLWIIQAFLIGVLFLAGNYYLWVGMGRIPGAERFTPYTKWMLLVLVIGVIVWATPHTMIANREELAAMGGSHHPFLGVLGVMSAKNTAVNLMILTTFLSFLLYRRANKQPDGALGEDRARWCRARCSCSRPAIVLFYGDLRLLRRGDRPHRLQRLSGAARCWSRIVAVTVIDILHGTRAPNRAARSAGARCRRARSTRCSSSP